MHKRHNDKKMQNSAKRIYITKMQVYGCACTRDVKFVRVWKENGFPSNSLSNWYFSTHSESSEVKGWAEHLLILSWVVALFVWEKKPLHSWHINSLLFGTLPLWIKTAVLSLNSFLQLPYDLDERHIQQQDLSKCFAKIWLALFHAPPTEFNVAVSLERIMSAWSKSVCACWNTHGLSSYILIQCILLVWFFNSIWYELGDLLKQKAKFINKGNSIELCWQLRSCIRAGAFFIWILLLSCLLPGFCFMARLWNLQLFLPYHFVWNKILD